MAPLLFKHMASNLFRQLVQMSWLSPAVSSPAASALRPLCGLAAAPRVLLTSVKTSSIATSPSGPICGGGPALSGLCRHIPCTQPSAGMKTKSALKRRCKDCFFVVRRGRLFVYCKTNPRHKQRQG